MVSLRGDARGETYVCYTHDDEDDGDRLGHYDVTARIGEGCMGQMYKCIRTLKERRHRAGSRQTTSGPCETNERKGARNGR